MSTPIRLGRGEDKSFTITFKDQNGAAIDLTGQTIRFDAKRSFKAADASLITKTSPAGGITINNPATAGIITLSLAAADTATLADVYTFEGVYDIGATDGQSKYRRLARGRLVVEHKVAP